MAKICTTIQQAFPTVQFMSVSRMVFKIIEPFESTIRYRCSRAKLPALDAHMHHYTPTYGWVPLQQSPPVKFRATAPEHSTSGGAGVALCKVTQTAQLRIVQGHTDSTVTQTRSHRPKDRTRDFPHESPER